MRKQVYVMANGTIETTMANAKAQEMPYTVAFENIKEEKLPPSEKKMTMRKKVK